jgi:hypothetical protein
MLEAGINAPAPVRGRLPVVCLRTSPHKAGTTLTPWEDELLLGEGRIVYFGDNRASKGTEAHETLGYRRMLEVFKTHQSPDQEVRADAAPILFFEAFEWRGRAKGQIRFHGVGVLRGADLVLQAASEESAFTNFRYHIELLDLTDDGNEVSWRWINARRDPDCSPEDAVKLAPRAWREWIDHPPP